MQYHSCSLRSTAPALGISARRHQAKGINGVVCTELCSHQYIRSPSSRICLNLSIMSERAGGPQTACLRAEETLSRSSILWLCVAPLLAAPGRWCDQLTGISADTVAGPAWRHRFNGGLSRGPASHWLTNDFAGQKQAACWMCLLK